MPAKTKTPTKKRPSSRRATPLKKTASEPVTTKEKLRLVFSDDNDVGLMIKDIEKIKRYNERGRRCSVKPNLDDVAEAGSTEDEDDALAVRMQFGLCFTSLFHEP